jgi:hypothetical protein
MLCDLKNPTPNELDSHALAHTQTHAHTHTHTHTYTHTHTHTRTHIHTGAQRCMVSAISPPLRRACRTWTARAPGSEYACRPFQSYTLQCARNVHSICTSSTSVCFFLPLPKYVLHEHVCLHLPLSTSICLCLPLSASSASVCLCLPLSASAWLTTIFQSVGSGKGHHACSHLLSASIYVRLSPSITYHTALGQHHTSQEYKQL